MKKLIVIILSLLLWLIVGQAYANVPQHYYANYEISEDIDRIMELFAEIEAIRNTWDDPSPEIFQEVNSVFNSILGHFPQDPDYQVIYNQCLRTTDTLSQEYSYRDFLDFRNRCFQEFNDIIDVVNSNFTIQPQIDAGPTEWSAPLSVTLDARWSIDPSNDTIPSSNFYWYYKDTEWNEVPIWEWPVVNHTFSEEWNYVVHLTVRSVNSDQWVFDGEESVNINVGPKAAVVSIHANNTELQKDRDAKVWLAEAEEGILFDWSWTRPTWWRQILTSTWEITWPDDFYHENIVDWEPWTFTLDLPNQWEYSVSLTVEDNQNNVVSEEYSLIVSDPVAQINYSELEGDTSTNFEFDAAPTYSIESSIQTYRWTIYDPNWNQIENLEQRAFERQFPEPWNYTIRLTAVDEMWDENDETIRVQVESSDPVPWFRDEPIEEWEYPSKFVLDATASYDVDVDNWLWEFEYDWRFSNRSYVNIEREINDWEKLIVSFDEPTTYEVTLEVSDWLGSSAEVQRTMEIESSLRPEINASPYATEFGEEITFSVTSNKTISHYEWDFGDWSSRQTQSEQATHTYDQTWVYQVELKASTQWWEENSVTRQIFIWEKDRPIPVYEVTLWDQQLSPDWVCEFEDDEGETKESPAFEVERYEDVLINASDSVNSQWETSDLDISFRPEDDQRYIEESFETDFGMKWCTYIELRVEDQQQNRTEDRKIWFDVQNAPPTIDNIEMWFPQLGRQMAVGFWEQQIDADSFFEAEYDPIIVELSASGAEDPDWHISHFKWYYYDADTPWRYEQVKTTPGNVGNISFSVPRVPWEFVFGVRLIDNDWKEVDSEQIIWKWPSIFFPPSTENPDIPMVTLKSNTTTTEVWQEVEFEVATQIMWDDENFERERTIRYDFDGDWEFDLTTKSDTATHIYEEPWEYRPRAKVTYRWYSGVDSGEQIRVNKGLNVWFMYDKFDNKVIFRDTSYWDIEKKVFCTDFRECTNWNEDYIRENKEQFLEEYDDYWQQVVSLEATDEHGNTDSVRQSIELEEESATWLNLMSIPSAERSDDEYVLEVWRSLDNSVLFYPNYEGEGDCYMDFDITHDSDWDWDPEGDMDLRCNELMLHEYTPSATSTTARIYYEEWGQQKTQDVRIEFMDVELDLDEEEKQVYQNLNNIAQELDTSDGAENRLRTLIINLKNSFWDSASMDSLVLQIHDWLDANQWVLHASLEQQLEESLEFLSSREINAAIWEDELSIAESNIKMFFPDGKQAELSQKFDRIDSADWNHDKIKSLLHDIIDMAELEKQEWTIDDIDYNIIQTEVCDLLDYYDIPSKACGTAMEEEPDQDFTDEEPEDNLFGAVITIILYIALTVFGLFILLVVIFAVKARMHSKDYSDEEEEEVEEDEDAENQNQEKSDNKIWQNW